MARKKGAKKTTKKGAGASARSSSSARRTGRAPKAAGRPQPLARRSAAGARGTPLAPVAPALFPPEELERLKLVALTSARREDKIEALRRIAYSPLPSDQKADIFLGRLADSDADVRIEAAQMLRSVGLDPEIAEAMREIEHGEEPQKLFAIDRLGRRMAAGGALNVGAGLIALLWRLREERSVAVRSRLLERLEDAADVIASVPARAEELMRLLVTLFSSDPINVGMRTRRLARKLGEHIPDQMRRTLWSEFDATTAGTLRVFVLQMLSALPGAASDERLPASVAGEIARAEECDLGFRALGDQLMQLGDAGIGALLDAFPRARPSQQSYIARLVADAARFGSVSAPAKERIGELFLGVLAGNQRELQMCIVQTQFPTDRDLSDQTRRRLAEAYLSHVHLFGFPSDIENVEHTVSRSGLAVVEPLIERLGPRGAPEDRTRAASILGELALVEGDPAGDAGAVRERLLDILRQLQRWSLEPDVPEKTAVFTAMGKVVSTPVIPPETVELVARNLLERRDAEGLGYRVLEALGYLAASPHVSAERVDQIDKLFRSQLEAELPEISTVESEEDGVAVFSIGTEAEMYTDAVPAAVRGLAQVALGRTARPARVAAATEFLLKLWEDVAAGKLQWGPPGSTALVSALRGIACGERINVAHKVAIVKSFARKMGQVPPLEALGAIFAAEDRSVDIGRLAAAAGVAILRRKVDGVFAEEEREHCLAVLASIAGRATLDTSTDTTRHLRGDIADELFAGVRDRVGGAYEALVRLRGSARLPAEFREDVARRLSAYESLVPA